MNVEIELGAMSIRWDQVAAYFPPQQSSEKLLIAPTESPDKPTQPRQLWTGWGQLAGTDVASGDESGQVGFIPPKGPSVNRPETLPVGTTIYDAGGVRLAVLPDRSVLTRSADDSRDYFIFIRRSLSNARELRRGSLSSQKATVIPSAKPAKLGLKDSVRDLETENHNLDGKLKEAMREINELKARIVELEEENADLRERLGEADLGHRPPNPNR